MCYITFSMFCIIMSLPLLTLAEHDNKTWKKLAKFLKTNIYIYKQHNGKKQENVKLGHE